MASQRKRQLQIGNYFRITEKKAKDGDRKNETEDTHEEGDLIPSSDSADNDENNDKVLKDNDSVGDHNPTSKQTKTKTRCYQKEWEAKFPWLLYDNGIMRCKVCLESKMKLSNPFASNEGCVNFRTSTLKRHSESADHKHASSSLILRHSMKVVVSRAFNEKEEAVLKLMRTVYYMAKNNASILQFESLLELMEMNGCDLKILNECYHSRKTADGLLKAISDAVNVNVKQKITESEYLSIMCDESTDISVSGKLIVYVITAGENLETETYFVSDSTIVNKTANGITDKLKQVIRDSDIDQQKVMALGSDGAATMTGRINGVGAQLRREQPFLLQFHCTAHKLALCTEQAANNIPGMANYKRTLTNIYYYFKASSSRSDKLKEVQDILDSPRLKMKEIHEVRWFAFYDALRAVHMCWEALAHTFSEAANKNPTAKGLLKSITQYSFVALTYFLMDVIPVVTRLNLKFQKEDLDVSMVGAGVRLTLHQLDAVSEGGCSVSDMTDNIAVVNGKHLFKDIEITDNPTQRQQFKNTTNAFISKLKDNLESRFPSETNNLTSAAEVLSLRGLSFIPKTELLEYGNGRIQSMLDHFGKSKDIDGKVFEPVMSASETMEEWKLVKELVIAGGREYNHGSLRDVWKYIHAHHGQQLPNLMKLVKLVLLFPLQTATCERGFSVQNATKTIKRNRLGDANLYHLMNISINGPPLKYFDFIPALRLWRSHKDRRLFSEP